MNKKTLFAGMLMIVVAAGAAAKEKTKETGPCPMRVAGAKVSVVKIDSGVVIHVTGADPATIASIQAAAEGEAGGAEPGCKHCAAAKTSHPKAEPACGHGESCGDAKAAVYTCAMGDYTGPATKDGRCPKCGMALLPKR